MVSDAVGCGPDLIREGVTGYTYPEGDIGELRRRLLHLASDPAARARMGAAAAVHVAAYSADAATAGVLTAGRAAAGRAPWPR